jgi:hypothetical protein
MWLERLRWLYFLPLVTLIALLVLIWIIRRPVVHLERFCDAIHVGESVAAVQARCSAAGFNFDSLVPRTPTVLIWVDDFPGRAICQLTLNDDRVEKRVFFAD